MPICGRNLWSRSVVANQCHLLPSFRFITSESVRTDIDGRVKVLLTNERVYFVKTSGVPSPESILVSLKFEDVVDCHHLKNGKKLRMCPYMVNSAKSFFIFVHVYTNCSRDIQ